MSAARKLEPQSGTAPLLRLYRDYLEETGEPAAAAIFAIDEYHRGEVVRTTGRTALTPPQVARQLGVDPATVIGWIRSGDLKASNVGKGGQRPRFRVQQGDLDVFMRKRQPSEKAAVRKSRHKHADDVIEFF